MKFIIVSILILSVVGYLVIRRQQRQQLNKAIGRNVKAPPRQPSGQQPLRQNVVEETADDTSIAVTDDIAEPVTNAFAFAMLGNILQDNIQASGQISADEQTSGNTVVSVVEVPEYSPTSVADTQVVETRYEAPVPSVPEYSPTSVSDSYSTSDSYSSTSSDSSPSFD